MRELEDARGYERLPAEYHRLEIAPHLLQASGCAQGWQHNPTIAMHEGQLCCVVRVMKDNVTWNFLGTLTDDLRLEDVRAMRDLAPLDRNIHVRSHGYEDMRLFSRRGRLCASATVCDRIAGDPRPKIAVLELDELGNVVDVHIQPSDREEKNWMPVVDEDELRFVYGLEPPTVVHYDDLTHLVSPPASKLPTTPGYLRGGSQLVRWDGAHRGWIAVVHEVHTGSARYLHRFVRFDRFLQVVAMGPLFFFQTEGIEFCAGLVHRPGASVRGNRGGHLLLSFGVSDNEAYIGKVDADVVERMVGA